MWSSSSTNSRCAALTVRLGLTLCAVLCGGCGGHGERRAPAPVRGTANLDALVRQHPGWRGVAQFDGALRRLKSAQTLAEKEADPALAILPAEDAALPVLPPAVREGQRQRLLDLQVAQVSRLSERRARARQTQIAALRPGWMRLAEGRYAQEAGQARADYARQARAARRQDDVHRVNLTLQIRALQNTIAAWKLSVPPTPQLNAAKRELAQKGAELARLENQQAGALAAAEAGRDKRLAAAGAERDAFVDAQAAQTETRLRAQDEAQIAALERRLAFQRQELLSAQGQATVPAVPAIGNLTAQALPPGPKPGALSAQQAVRSAGRLEEARTRLAGQRARWVAFLYDDTRAAAEDAARQHGWRLTFSGPRAGQADLTMQVARTLSQDVWKQN